MSVIKGVRNGSLADDFHVVKLMFWKDSGRRTLGGFEAVPKIDWQDNYRGGVGRRG